jgi:hypothetical protein
MEESFYFILCRSVLYETVHIANDIAAVVEVVSALNY